LLLLPLPLGKGKGLFINLTPGVPLSFKGEGDTKAKKAGWHGVEY